MLKRQNKHINYLKIKAIGLALFAVFCCVSFADAQPYLNPTPAPQVTPTNFTDYSFQNSKINQTLQEANEELKRPQGDPKQCIMNGKKQRYDGGIVSTACIEDKNKKTCLDTMPIDAPNGVKIRVSSTTGERLSPTKKVWQLHQGIDYAATTSGALDGATVKASADGCVYAMQEGQGNTWDSANDKCTGSASGNYVSIRHFTNTTTQPRTKDDYEKICYGEGKSNALSSQTFVTKYVHLRKGSVKVSKGDVVKKGQMIGAVGNTGCSTGPHLHYAIMDSNGKVLDPLCDNIMGLCGGKTVDLDEDCTNCKSNPTQCNAVGTGASNPCPPEYEVAPPAPTTEYDTQKLIDEATASDKPTEMPATTALHAVPTHSGRYIPSKGQNGTCREIPENLRQIIGEMAEKYKIDPVIIVAIIEHESAFNSNATSKSTSTGKAMGYMQLMPSTVTEQSRQLGLPSNIDPYDPRNNIMMGTHLIASLINKDGVNDGLINYAWGTGNHNKYKRTIAEYNAKTTDKAPVFSPEQGYKAYEKLIDAYNANKTDKAPKFHHEAGPFVSEFPDFYNNVAECSKLGKFQNTNSTFKTMGCWPSNDYKGTVSTDTSGDPLGAPGAKQKCNYEDFRSSYDSCVFCPMFKILFNTASEIAGKAWITLVSSVEAVVLVATALWLAMTVLKHISTIKVADAMQLTKEILNQLFVVLIVLALLRLTSQDFWNLFLKPLFMTGMKLAQLTTEMKTCSNDFGVLKDGGIPHEIGDGILCTIQSMQGKILDVTALGTLSMCIGLFVESSYHIPLFPHFGYLIIGLLLWIASIVLLIVYPWLLVDVILQMAVVVALIPAAIGCYAFKITRKLYVNSILHSIFNAVLNFVFLSLILYVMVTQIEVALGEDFQNRMTQVSGDRNFSAILTEFSWTGIVFLKLVFIMILGWAVLAEGKGYAKAFSSGLSVGGNIGANVGGMAAGATKRIGGKAMGVGLRSAKAAGGMALDVAKGLGGRAKMNFSANKVLNSKNAVTNEDGSVSVTRTNFRGRTITQTVSMNSDGQKQLTKSVTKKNGQTTTTKTDKFMSSTKTTDKDGNVVSSTSKFSPFMANLTHKDGTMNQNAMNNMMQNSAHSQDDIQEAMLQQILKERMPGVANAKMDGKFAKRSIIRSTDEKGREVFSIAQTNTNGSVTLFSMTNGGDHTLASVKHINKDGSAETFASDGIVNKHSTSKFRDGVEEKEKATYAFSNYYSDKDAFDSNGNISDHIPADNIMFGAKDMDVLKDQYEDTGASYFGNKFR